jgi:hypothetical protein
VTEVTAELPCPVLDGLQQRKNGWGVMTQKFTLDRYDLALAIAIALFAAVAISLMLT